MSKTWWQKLTYYDLPVVAFPYRHPSSDLEITEFTIRCRECEKACVGTRAKAYYHDRCIEIRAVGLCHQCKLITFSRFRAYGHGLLLEKKNGWKHRAWDRSLWDRAKLWMANLLEGKQP